MTTHIRKQLRGAVATALTGLTTTGSRVHQSHMRPLGAAALPCLLVAIDGTEVETSVHGEQQRALTVIVQGVAKATTTVEDTLDQIAMEVETAAYAAGTLSGLVPGGLEFVKDHTEFDDTLDQPAGVIVLEFRAFCFTRVGTPGAAI